MRKWIEAMRLRTLPVSVAGVLAGIGCAIWKGCFSVGPALLCMLFALTAQVASNFGNEYYDFRNGIDRKGRVGFRRGVSEGDITPQAMRRATFATLALASAFGCCLLYYGGWWLLPAGVCIVLGALAYSAGPYPLSHHGLGDVAVVLFFGIVPVTLTCYLQEGGWTLLRYSLPLSLTVGMLADNVLIVNNYRDTDDDAEGGKYTTAVLFGRTVMGRLYLISGCAGMLVMIPVWTALPVWSLLVPLCYLVLHVKAWRELVHRSGCGLNPLLKRTALNLLVFTLLLCTAFVMDFRTVL